MRIDQPAQQGNLKVLAGSEKTDRPRPADHPVVRGDGYSSRLPLGQPGCGDWQRQVLHRLTEAGRGPLDLPAEHDSRVDAFNEVKVSRRLKPSP